MTVFCNLDYPNHTLVGGVSVVASASGLFALSVNRHSNALKACALNCLRNGALCSCNLPLSFGTNPDIP